jgi:hypothetical protein
MDLKITGWKDWKVWAIIIVVGLLVAWKMNWLPM